MAEKVVVLAHSVEVKQRLVGGVSIHYACPACKEELETKESDVLAGDTCPTCSMNIQFDETINAQFRKRLLEKKKQQETKEQKKIAATKAGDKKDFVIAEEEQPDKASTKGIIQEWQEKRQLKKPEKQRGKTMQR